MEHTDMEEKSKVGATNRQKRFSVLSGYEWEELWKRYKMKEKVKRVGICALIAILTAIFAVSVYVAAGIMAGIM